MKPELETWIVDGKEMERPTALKGALDKVQKAMDTLPANPTVKERWEALEFKIYPNLAVFSPQTVEGFLPKICEKFSIEPGVARAGVQVYRKLVAENNGLDKDIDSSGVEGRDNGKAWQPLKVPELLEYLEGEDTQPYDVDGLVPEKSLTIISGSPGSGKSWTGLILAKSISEGQPFIGRRTKQKDVFYFDLEMSRPVVKQRLTLLRPFNVYYIPRFFLDNFHLQDKNLDGLAETGGVLIFDNASKLAIGKDTNSAQDVSPITARLRALVDKGATVILVTHPPKSEVSPILGSQAWLAECDCAYVLEKKDGLLTLRSVKHRMAGDFTIPLRLTICDSGVELRDISEDIEAKQVARERSELEQLKGIMQKLSTDGEPPAQEELVSLAKVEMEKGRHAVLKLLRKGEGTHWRKGKYTSKPKVVVWRVIQHEENKDEACPF